VDEGGVTAVLVHNISSDECLVTPGAFDRLTVRQQAIKSSISKRMRPETVSEMKSTSSSGLSVVTYGVASETSLVSASPSLRGILYMLSHTQNQCSEIDCINNAIQIGIDPRGSFMTTMGITSKRIGAALDGQLMAPCVACMRVLNYLDINYLLSRSGARGDG
jgi:hypothetical protein